MVKALHAAGIEVILDVVYNHTAEGNQLGPTLSLRGIDNAAYYRLSPDDRRYYMDFTGCGNTLNMTHPRVLQLIMDSLRYWVLEMHVDGFRFDLASALARELYEVDRLGRVLRHHPSGPGALAGQADRRAVGSRRGRLSGRQLPGAVDRMERPVPRLRAPLLAGRRRHASPSWRRGWPAARTCTRTTAGGRTPASTSSPRTTASRCTTWSPTSRSTTRPTARTTATARTTTSAGTAASKGRPTIRRSASLRERQKRNLLATLFLSQGVPMISGGDELGRTQHGNNNAYCQDNEISWTDWTPTDERRRSSTFACRVSRLMRDAPGPASAPVLSRPPLRGSRRQGHHVAGARRAGDDRSRVERRPRQVPRRAAGGRGHRRGRRRRRADRRRHAAVSVERRARCRAVHAAVLRRRRPRWECLLDTFDERRVGQVSAGGVAYPLAIAFRRGVRAAPAGEERRRDGSGARLGECEPWRPRLGAWPDGRRECMFRVWAPGRGGGRARAASRAPGVATALPPDPRGRRHVHRDASTMSAAGALCTRTSLDGEGPFPDPASRYQPEGVHGPSAVVDPGAYPWTRPGDGAACRSATPSSTSCTSAPSPRRAPSPARRSGCRTWRSSA